MKFTQTALWQAILSMMIHYSIMYLVPRPGSHHVQPPFYVWKILSLLSYAPPSHLIIYTPFNLLWEIHNDHKCGKSKHTLGV